LTNKHAAKLEFPSTAAVVEAATAETEEAENEVVVGSFE
jgi:hypothetical protein